MIRNYFIIAFRNLANNTFYSFISIFGLSVGIACCLILSLLIIDQLSFDRQNKNKDDLYRIVHRQVEKNISVKVAYTQGLLAPELKKNFGEIKAATRVGVVHENIIIEGKDPVDKKVLAVDSSFFSMFTLPCIQGSVNKGLSEDEILVSESEAANLYGKASAIGKVITIRGIADFTIVGVYKDMLRSHLRSDLIISFSWIEKRKPDVLSWNFNSYYNYLLFEPGYNVTAFNKKMDAFIHQHTPAAWKSYEYFLQPLLDVYTDNDFQGNPAPASGKIYAYAFTGVGVVILMLACFNYMNMATARSAGRAREVGVRKVMGAYRIQLMGQFLTESFIICTCSFLLGILWADLALPLFQSFTNSSKTEMMRFDLGNFFNDYRLVAGLITSNFLLAFLAGVYPAIFLSRFMPSVVLKGRKIVDSSRRLRVILASFQFTLSSILIIVVTLIFRQVQFMKSKDLGFNKEGLLLFAAARNENISLESFKAELEKTAGVKQIASASILPGRLLTTSSMRVANTSLEENIKVGWASVDHDYIPVLQLTLLAGRNFYPNQTDSASGLIINEKAAKALGWTPEQALGKKISGIAFNDSLPGTIIGVIKDFHLSSLRKEIGPLALSYKASNNRYIVRLEGTALPSTAERVRKALLNLVPNTMLEPILMEDYLDNIYQLEEKLGQLLTFFTVLAVIIGCLGLYALSAYEGQQRTKELGIRKIMGATSWQILSLLTRSYLKPVFISFLIAMPLAFLLGNLWLRSFAYHTPWSMVIFFQSALWIFILGWLTIVGQGIKASSLNPADALRHE